MEELARVTLLGVRGSAPACDIARFGKYGCGTVCVLLRMAGETIVLDAGSGLMDLDVPEGRCTILLSHAHVDHLLGLPACPKLYEPGFAAAIYAAARGGGPREQVSALMTPPLWPVGPEAFRAAVAWRPLPEGAFQLGRVEVSHTPGNHPGGVTLFRLSAGGRSMVYATDCELDEATKTALIPFAKGCDLLLCDAQYTDEEYADKAGWGHSAVSMALGFSAACGAKRTVLLHHAPERTDAALDALAETLKDRPDCALGRQGETFSL